jgi:hypothetical protein
MKVLLLFLFGFSALSQSFDLPASIDPLQNSKLVCRERVQKLIAEWGVTKKWRGNLDPQGFQSISPTQKLGVWASLLVKEKSVELIRYSPSENLTENIQGQDCVSTLTITKKTTQKENSFAFTDEKFRKLLLESAEQKTSGLIYVWSPHMNWSKRGAEEIKKVAEEMKLKLTLLVDPDISEKEMTLLNQKDPMMMTLQSQELFFRGVRNHYPTFVYYSNGTLKPYVKTGYDKPEVLKEILEVYAKR